MLGRAEVARQSMADARAPEPGGDVVPCSLSNSWSPRVVPGLAPDARIIAHVSRQIKDILKKVNLISGAANQTLLLAAS